MGSCRCPWSDSTGPSAFPQRYSSGTLQRVPQSQENSPELGSSLCLLLACCSPAQNRIWAESLPLKQSQGCQVQEKNAATLGPQGCCVTSYQQNHSDTGKTSRGTAGKREKVRPSPSTCWGRRKWAGPLLWPLLYPSALTGPVHSTGWHPGRAMYSVISPLNYSPACWQKKG